MMSDRVNNRGSSLSIVIIIGFFSIYIPSGSMGVNNSRDTVQGLRRLLCCLACRREVRGTWRA